MGSRIPITDQLLGARVEVLLADLDALPERGRHRVIEDGMQRSQDGSGRHRRGSGVGRIHEVLLPVMRASTRDEMWRISFTSRSSSRLFSIHSL